jgi:hypothetical protein
MLFADKTRMVTEAAALKGRSQPMRISGVHTITGQSMVAPFAPQRCVPHAERPPGHTRTQRQVLSTS